MRKLVMLQFWFTYDQPWELFSGISRLHVKNVEIIWQADACKTQIRFCDRWRGSGSEWSYSVSNGCALIMNEEKL